MKPPARIFSFTTFMTVAGKGSPFELSPTMLYRELLITSGTMTHRLNTLEKQGLIERVKHPSDRRGLLVRFTKKGLTLINNVIKQHLDNERELFKSISAKDAKVLSSVLGNWIEGLEGGL